MSGLLRVLCCGRTRDGTNIQCSDRQGRSARGKIPKGEVAKSDTDTVSVVFKNVKQGTYAVSIFQDLNGNKMIDKNFIGNPKEPYGFSGAWKSGRASFKKAAFTLKPGSTKVAIKLK